jgi:hypothetical protein
MKERNLERWLALGLALVVLLAVAVRLRLLSTPLERDEGEYAYAGQLMLEGIPPYKLAFNIKLPGTYASYAVLMGIFGQTTEGIHLGFLLVNLATMTLVFLIARRLLDTPQAIVACASYALLSLSPVIEGLQGHATHTVVLMAMGGVWLLLRARASGRAWSYVLSGVLFGLSFVCKQPWIFFGMFGGAVLLRDAASAPSVERRRKWLHFAVFCAGAATPFLATCCWMWCAGTFHRFWFWTMVFAPVHGGQLREEQVWWQLDELARHAIALEEWGLAAVVGLVCLLIDPEQRNAKFFIAGLLGFTLMALTVSLYFYPHYFILLLPVVSLLTAAAVRGLVRVTGWKVAGCGFALACVGFILANRTIWFQSTPEDAVRAIYPADPFPEAVKVARYIREHSSEQDTIGMLGSEPEIFFHALRHSASGYIYMYDLMKMGPYAPIMQADLQRDIEQAKPLFLVIVNVPSSWSRIRNSDTTIFDWSRGYAGKYYRPAAQISLGGMGRTENLQELETGATNYDAQVCIVVLRRKPGI